MIAYVILQLYSGLCALFGLGQTVSRDASKFDKICGYIACLVFLVFILIIERLK